MQSEVQTMYLPALIAADTSTLKRFENIRGGMKTVVMQREGYMIDETQTQSIMTSSLEACHQFGLLQSQYIDDNLSIALAHIYPTRVATGLLADHTLACDLYHLDEGKHLLTLFQRNETTPRSSEEFVSA